MDLFALKSLLFVLSFTGCRAMSLLPDGPVDALAGTDVTLQTLLKDHSFMVMIWSYSDGSDMTPVATYTAANGLKEGEGYAGRVEMNSTNGFLTLKGLKPEDSGDYSFNLVKPDGSSSTAEIKLNVMVPVSDVLIKSNLNEAIEHNSTVILTCSAKGSFLKFTWLKGTTPIKEDGKRITLTEAEQTSTLTVKNILRTDLDGPIVCKAANKLQNDKSPAFSLTVFYGPEEVTLLPKNPPQYLKSRSIFNFTCSATSNPPATFSWDHDKQKMAVTSNVLTLADIEKAGLGKKLEEYTCTATNAKTLRAVSSAAVSFGVMEGISGTKVSGPTATLIAGNSTANLSCSAMAGTVKSTVWKKDGKLLTASDRLVIASDMSSLMIKVLQKEDNGEYMCELTNPVGTDKASYKMVVNYGPEQAMVKGRDEMEMNEDETLTCTAASIPPANFTWKFNGTMTATKMATYKVENARFKNSGLYTCEASNAVTGKTAKSTHNLIVREEGALDDEGLSDGAIAGIVIGILAALGAAIAVIMYCRQKVPVESPY